MCLKIGRGGRYLPILILRNRVQAVKEVYYEEQWDNEQEDYGKRLLR